jgi:hypothetical protein
MGRLLSAAFSVAIVAGLCSVSHAALHSSWENASDGWQWNGGPLDNQPANSFSSSYATNGSSSFTTTVTGVPGNGYFTFIKNFPSVTSPAEFYQQLRPGATVEIDYTVIKTANGAQIADWSEIVLAWVGDDGVGSQNIPYADLKSGTAVPVLNQPLTGTATFNVTPKDDVDINNVGGYFGLFLGYNTGHFQTGFTGDVGTFSIYIDNLRITSVPEPMTAATLSALVLAGLRRRR